MDMFTYRIRGGEKPEEQACPDIFNLDAAVCVSDHVRVAEYDASVFQERICKLRHELGRTAAAGDGRAVSFDV